MRRAPDRPAVRPTSPAGYDAFISYSRADTAIATRVQQVLQKLTKPWYRRRVLRVFRDSTSLAAGPALWPPIQRALDDSRYLILVGSPAAAESMWVGEEVRYWTDRRGLGQLVIVVTAGEIGWDRNFRGFDASTNCLPAVLQSRFADEPLWVDMRPVSGRPTTDAVVPLVASVFAGITGRPKDEVIGEDLRQHKRARRIATAAASLIAVLALLAGVAAVVAYQQRGIAQANERQATVRALSAAGQAAIPRRLNESLLLSAAAHSRQDDDGTEAVLFQALTSSPHLVRFSGNPGPVTRAAWVGSKHLLAAGGDSFLSLTDADTGGYRSLIVAGRVSALASSSTGDAVVVGFDSGQVGVVDTATATLQWQHPVLSGPVVAVAVNPGGTSIAVVNAVGSLAVLSSAGVAAVTGVEKSDNPVTFLSFLANGSQLAIGDDNGEVAVLVAATLGVLQPWSDAHARADTLPRLAYLTVGDAVSDISGDFGSYLVKPILGAAPALEFARGTFGEPSAIAVSPVSRAVAIDNDGQLQVDYATDKDNPGGTHVTLPGSNTAGAQLAFSADGTLLASSDESSVAIWRPGGSGGLAQVLPTKITSIAKTDNHTPAALDVSRARMIWSQAAEFGAWTTVCVDIATGRQTQSPGGGDDLQISPDGSTVTARSDPSAYVVWKAAAGCPSAPTRVTLPKLSADVVAVAPQDDRSLLVLTADGALARVDSAGKLLTASPAPASSASAAAAGVSAPVYPLAIAPGGARAATGLSSGAVVGFDISGGRIAVAWSAQAAAPIEATSWCGASTLAVSDSDGDVTLLDGTNGQVLKRLSGARGGRLTCTASGRLLVVVGPQNRAAVWRVNDGALLGTFLLDPVSYDPTSLLRLGRVSSDIAMTVLPDATDGVWFLQPGIAPTRWDLNPDHWRSVACAQAGRDLSAAEWTATVGSAPAASLSCTGS